MANNTYVYVGFYEADITQSETTRPQQSGIGRIYIGVVASKDGSCGYIDGTWPSPKTNTNLQDISKLKHFDGVHLIGKSIVNTLTNMGSDIDNNLDLSTESVTPFNGPASTAASVCTFTKVVQFNPSGAANIITKLTRPYSLAPYIQLGIVPTHGKQIDSNAPNCAGIQIDGITGAVCTFRPGQP